MPLLDGLGSGATPLAANQVRRPMGKGRVRVLARTGTYPAKPRLISQVASSPASAEDPSCWSEKAITTGGPVAVGSWVFGLVLETVKIMFLPVTSDPARCNPTLCLRQSRSMLVTYQMWSFYGIYRCPSLPSNVSELHPGNPPNY